MHPDAPFIKRQGEVNAWDNADFRAAVRETGKKQVILAGIVTDVRRSPTVISLSLLTALLLGMHGLPRALPSGRRLHRLCERRGLWYFERQDRRRRE